MRETIIDTTQRNQYHGLIANLVSLEYESSSILLTRECININIQNTYFSRHNDKCDVGNTGFVEGSGIRDVDPHSWAPVPYSPQLLSFQFQKVQFEVTSFALVELYVPRQTV